MTNLQPVNPPVSSAHLLRFTTEQGFSAPRRVEVAPAIGASTDHCYINVEQQLERFGGLGVYGWKIIDFPRLFLQAIHHAVWQSKSGQLVDVTPEIRNWREVVFAPDETISYCGVPPKVKMPRFLNYSGLREVDELIDLSLQLTERRIQSALPSGAMPQLDVGDPWVKENITRSRNLFDLAAIKVGAR